MKLPKTAHTSRPWRVHEITRDFRVEDVWALPTPGGPDDLERLVRQFTAPPVGDRRLPALVRIPMELRWKIGALLGWDGDKGGLGARVATLRDRLPDDLRDGERGPDTPTLPFRSVFQTHDEWAAEIANKTVHAVMHISWVPDDSAAANGSNGPGGGSNGSDAGPNGVGGIDGAPGGYRGQMAVLVKPNGWFGRAYMAAIAPFRHLIVYPPLLRSIGREWSRDSAARKPL